MAMRFWASVKFCWIATSNQSVLYSCYPIYFFYLFSHRVRRYRQFSLHFYLSHFALFSMHVFVQVTLMIFTFDEFSLLSMHTWYLFRRLYTSLLSSYRIVTDTLIHKWLLAGIMYQVSFCIACVILSYICAVEVGCSQLRSTRNKVTKADRKWKNVEERKSARRGKNRKGMRDEYCELRWK